MSVAAPRRQHRGLSSASGHQALEPHRSAVPGARTLATLALSSLGKKSDKVKTFQMQVLFLALECSRPPRLFRVSSWLSRGGKAAEQLLGF